MPSQNHSALLFSCFSIFCLLPSCTGFKTAEELHEIRKRPLQAVQGLKVNPPRIEEGAYQAPSGVDVSMAEGIGTQTYIMSGGDNILGTVVGGVVRGIAAGQQGDFESRQQQHFAAIKSLVESEAPAAVQEAVQRRLKPTVLGPRLNQKPYDSALYTDIRKLGLVRVGVSPSGEVLLAPMIWLKISTLCFEVLSEGQWVKGNPERTYTGEIRPVAAGNWYFQHTSYVGNGPGHVLTDYLTKPGLLKTEFLKTTEEALINLPESVARRFDANNVGE